MATSKKTTGKTATALTTANTNVPMDITQIRQDNIPTLIESFKSQLTELKGNSEQTVDLNTTVEGGRSIKDIKKVSDLLEIEAAVTVRSEAYARMLEKYDLTGKVSEYKYEGKTLAEMQAVIAKAIHLLLNAKKIEQLETAIQEMSKHLDANTRLQQTIVGIMTSATAPIE